MASSYQVNLAIEIYNITQNYINLHIFTCRQWVSANYAYLNIRRIVGTLFFFDWPDIFYSGGLGANRNVSGKLGMKLAIA